MRTDRSLLGLAGCLAGVVVWVCAGCTSPSGGGGEGGDGTGNANANANDNATNDNVAPDPVRCRDNTPPAGELIFPPVGGDVSVEPGEVAVIWEVEDSDGGEVTITVFINDQPDVFDNPLFTQEVREDLIAGAGPVQQRATVELTRTGTFYAGVEITDDCDAAVRRPADGQGARFVVALGGEGGRVDAAGVILLCPRDAQLARRATTFEWSMGNTQAQGISLFVSRADQSNPFNSPLLVLRDIQPDQASVALEDENLLPVGEELSWGLRIQTQDEVLFTFDGQVGRSFTVGDNVAPTGELLGPEAGAVLADATASLLLRWQADAGNCEDTLTSTVFFEFLGDRNAPQALFESPISEQLGENRLELNVSTVRDRLDQGGLWAWGVLAGDGTDSTELPAVQSQANFLTFVRNTAPRFDALPAIGQRVCGLQSGPIDTVEFTYADDNGLNTVAVTLYYADVEADVFDALAATQAFPPDQIASTAGRVGLVVDARGGTGCLEFNHGLGFYGVELDDGVNGPVRATIEYAGLDCNNNDIVDAADLAGGASLDCNRNQIPDECELATGDGNGNGILDVCEVPGVILICPGDAQLARRATTFEWSMGNTQAQGISLFVSRADQSNPFNSPLLVLRDIQPDQASVALEDENLLPVGEELSWGLRIETQDAVLFTFEGQVGRSFTVGENVAPTGGLLGPDAGAVLADATASLLLRWQADAGNCEDTLTSTVFFEFLGDRNAPQALFESPISEQLGENRLELNVSTVRDRLDQGGLWAWGVLAGDGTDSTELPAVQSQANFLTFVRNTAPEFVVRPAIGQRVCGLQSGPIDTLEFTYADDNGLNSVAVTLYYADVEADVFDAPAATETFAPDQIASTAGQVGLVVDARGGTGCLEFNQGLGFYGVELDDGVNGPVRAAIEYAGLDCNKNGIVDSADIASGTSRDCNRNGIPDDCELATGDGNGNGVLDVCEVPQFPDCNGNGIPDSQDIASETSNDCNADGIPDECQGSPLCDAGTLRTGVIAGGAYDSVENEVNTNHLRGNICNVPAGRPAAVPSWTLDSRPPGSEVFINSPATLTSSYFIRPAVSGSYVFRLTETLSGVSDTVALTLVALQ